MQQLTHEAERAETLSMLRELEKKVLWLSSWMIHHANHERDTGDGVKVGGHQASSASVAPLLTALYFHVLRPEDRVAVKPHASPVFHAIQYLLGQQTLDNLKNFRAFGGAQSYPSRTKDKDDVDFSTGSVGLGVAVTAFASLVQDYVRSHGWGKGWPEGRMISILGDAELDEGNIHECLLECWKHGLKNCWWIIDYNRQSLDNVVSDELFHKLAGIFATMGWEIVTLKYGSEQERLFKRPGGEALRRWIDDCPNLVYSALTFEGGAAFRRQIEQDLKGEAETLRLIGEISDADLHRLLTNLGGTDLASILNAFERAPADRPVCFIAYTIKGFGLPFQGHKDNHAGLMTKAQMQALRERMRISEGAEWDRFAGLGIARDRLEAFLSRVPFASRGRRRLKAERIAVPELPRLETKGSMSTQEAFGRFLSEVGRSVTPLAARIVTTAPDVTVSTNLGPWVNRRGLFALRHKQDVFKDRGLLSPQRWEMTPEGQHIELGIAENNLFLMLAALGLSHSLFGERLIPIGTVYDPFIARGLDALNYACYMDARFILVGTPSGLTLAPEGGAHQSIGTPLIGMAQDGLATFEPAFADELREILAWSFDYVQRAGSEEKEAHWHREEKGGSVYLRLSTRPIEQVARTVTPELASDIIGGGYWLREPGPGCELVIVYTGAVAPEAIAAAGMLGEDRRGVGLLAVTSADRLSAGWHAAERERERGEADARSHAEKLLAAVPRDAKLLTVLDGYPETLSWMGGVYGHKVRALGVEHFGQSGSVPELYAHYRIDTNAILAAAQALTPGRPVRYARRG